MPDSAGLRAVKRHLALLVTLLIRVPATLLVTSLIAPAMEHALRSRANLPAGASVLWLPLSAPSIATIAWIGAAASLIAAACLRRIGPETRRRQLEDVASAMAGRTRAGADRPGGRSAPASPAAPG